MPQLTIRAHFPLGVFQGHEKDGSSSRLPDTARLYSALVNAAGQGTAAERGDDGLQISADSARALGWIENHPPKRLMVPVSIPVQTGPRPLSYRNEGTAEKPKSVLRLRKTSTEISEGTALLGDFGWCWDDAPTEVREALERLCPDVSCLGETDSPVVLTLDPIESTHELVSEASQLRPRGTPVRTPHEGRLEELERAWDEEHRKIPSMKDDRPMESSDGPRTRPIPTGSLGTLYYERPGSPLPEDPWAFARLVPTDRALTAKNVVAWCVAFHRMLIALLGNAAPASVTGHYAPGAPRPANLVAIQYLPANLLAGHSVENDFPHGAFLLLFPRDLASEDRERIDEALRTPHKRLWKRRDEEALVLGAPFGIALSEFWPALPQGWRRSWRSLTGLVPETRRQAPHPSLGRWGFEQAALLSLGHVFRDQLDLPSGRNYWAVVESVLAQGARVTSTHRVPDPQTERFAHKAPSSIGTVQPYTAVLEPGRLISDRALIAIGQSRHLGGGLLVPVDSPEES